MAMKLIVGIILSLAVMTVLGNLITIGPGLYSSNHTLDGATRGIYILNSCEFMHNGKLETVTFYVATSGWLALQIWRPIGQYPVTGKMRLKFEKIIKVSGINATFDISFLTGEIIVQSGDILGFTKLNDSFPIPYIFNPHQSAALWYHSIDDVIKHYPQTDDIIEFEEMGFPYQFSVTARFKPDVKMKSLSKIQESKSKESPKHNDIFPTINSHSSRGNDQIQYGLNNTSIPHSNILYKLSELAYDYSAINISKGNKPSSNTERGNKTTQLDEHGPHALFINGYKDNGTRANSVIEGQYITSSVSNSPKDPTVKSGFTSATVKPAVDTNQLHTTDNALKIDTVTNSSNISDDVNTR